MWTWAGLFSQTLNSPAIFFYTSLFPRRKRIQWFTKAKLLLKEYLLCSKTFWTSGVWATTKPETGLGLRSSARNSQGQRMETFYWNTNSSCSQKLAILTKRKPGPPKFPSTYQKWERFQDEEISGKFLDLTSNSLLAISPTDVTEPERMFQLLEKSAQKYFRYFVMTP